jgi:hypothetical protein
MGEPTSHVALEVRPVHPRSHPVLGWLHLYRCMPKERIRVFLSTSPEHMEKMLSRANQGLLCTAITGDQHCVSWIEVRRLEIELGAGGDHDQPYTWSLLPSGPHMLAWAKLRARRVCDEFDL